MFESHDWSATLTNAIENFLKKFLNKKDAEELEKLLALAYGEGFDVGFAEAAAPPEREEDG